jgi:hypothetical protein
MARIKESTSTKNLSTTAPSVDAVRPQVRDMVASGEENDFRVSLAQPSPEAEAAPRRTRRSKAEMAAARAQEAGDSNMSDPIYAKSIARLQGFKVDGIIGLACMASGKPMSDDEDADIKALTYVAAKRAKVDIGSSWWALALSFIGIAASMVLTRVGVMDRIKAFFDSLKPKPEEVKK